MQEAIDRVKTAHADGKKRKLKERAHTEKKKRALEQRVLDTRRVAGDTIKEEIVKWVLSAVQYKMESEIISTMIVLPEDHNIRGHYIRLTPEEHVVVTDAILLAVNSIEGVKAVFHDSSTRTRLSVKWTFD